MNYSHSKWKAFSLVIITALLLIPFINKAFHIDDTLFLWCAEQIQKTPFDFYGFNKNWYVSQQPMFIINQNPPLVSYYISLVSYFFGWHEIVLHIAFIIPAVLCSVGVYYLACFFCVQPYVAALISVLSPAFIVSSTTIMSDISMMALYVWSAVLWLYGIEREKYSFLIGAAVLISISSLYKYFGITMVPLLFIYTLLVRRRIGVWICYLFVPIMSLWAYQEITYRLYESKLFFNAASYALGRGGEDNSTILIKIITVLSFSGGCMASAFFFTHLLWTKRTLILGVIVFILLFLVIFFVKPLTMHLMPRVADIKWYASVQLALFVMLGIQVVWLTVADVLAYRDSKALLLFLWVSGTLVFSGFVNWSINARVILPLVPALGIIVARRLEKRIDLKIRHSLLKYMSPIILAGLFSMSIAWADTTLANCQRTAARYFNNKFRAYDRSIWFQGHWGFQYYMESFGAKPVDVYHSLIEKGDIIISPSSNTNTHIMPLSHLPEILTLIDSVRIMPCKWLTTISLKSGAGFYSDIYGPLPYLFGRVHPEQYKVFMADRTFDFIVK